MNEKLKPMDVYADLTIPFDVAAYCRGHKFTPQAVGLTQAIRARHVAKLAIEMAEREFSRTEAAVTRAIDAARKRMESDPNV